ncbi:hypothetical protein SE17_38480 [Kouleothrix aurantiaca]|uniref:Uncharacterized protein n=1 Tax=Kouleothrix aurantiaca TaxID=186479 RepID=A0A0P9EVH4_9CHLR|nr:hypothetical protein SE17_38480 [Kouleothrix aurantiaca]
MELQTAIDFYHGLLANMEARAVRQPQQVDPAGRNIFAHIASPHAKPGRAQLVVQLAVDQMHLPQVRLRGVGGDARAVLHGDAQVRIARHAQPFQQFDARLAGLAE